MSLGFQASGSQVLGVALEIVTAVIAIQPAILGEAELPAAVAGCQCP